MVEDLSKLEQFVDELAARWDKPIRLLITGAWAVTPWGSIRATNDIDFEVNGLQASEADAFNAAARAAGHAAKIAAQYSTDIDRWSSIVLLDYRQHTHPWKRVGSIDVHMLDPKHWSIGKLSRYIDTDVEDMIQVFRQAKTDPIELATLWYAAIKRSPPSSQQWSTKQHALIFFRQHGRHVWGDQLPLEHIEQMLHGTVPGTKGMGETGRDRGHDLPIS